MPGIPPLSLKQVDPGLRHKSDLRMQRLALVTASISFVGVSLFCAVVALYIPFEQHEFCHTCT